MSDCQHVPDGGRVKEPVGNVSGMRYRCNLGLWVVAALMVLPYAVIVLLGPALIAISNR